MPVMPVILTTNRLLSWLAGFFCAYWAAGFIAEPLLFSAVISACVFVGGIMVAVRAVPDAFHIVRRDQLGPGELAVIAVALLSTGAVWSGAGNVLYAYNDRPPEWIGPLFSFGRAAMAMGFFVLFLSPETTRQGIKWPRWYILLTASILILVIGILIGIAVRPGGELTVGESTLPSRTAAFHTVAVSCTAAR